MYRPTSFFLLLVPIFLVCAAWAQDTTSTATCNFDVDKELTVEYQRVSFDLKKSAGHEVPYGKPWAPGGRPMTLFTNSEVEIGGKVLPVGAYTMFAVPTQKRWTLIVSKSTDMTGRYDEQQDLVRVAMESGELAAPEPMFKASFAHVAPDQCNFRLDLAKVANWATFQKR
jgi:hypothetical protein